MEGNIRGAALAFLRAQELGVLTTVSAEGDPRARLVYYAVGDDFSVYFVTHAQTRKALDLAHNPRASFVVADEAVPQTAQVEGTVTNLTDQTTVDPMLATLTERLLSNTVYGAPLMRFDPDTLLYFRLIPHFVKWGDFTQGHTTDEVIATVPL